MPFRRDRKKSELPSWQEKVAKNGIRGTIFAVNGDTYKGEWKDNLKHGKGRQLWLATGVKYEGEWEFGKRSGFGVLNVPVGSGKFIRRYIGQWKNNRMHGFGSLCYGQGECYDGEFENGLRHGWGRMQWANGDVYEGEWKMDMRHGKGMLEHANGQRMEGYWKSDKRYGPGKHYFPETGQVLKGFWVNDICKTGTMQDIHRERAPDATPFPIPECKVQNINGILKDACRSYVPQSVSQPTFSMFSVG